MLGVANYRLLLTFRESYDEVCDHKDGKGQIVEYGQG